MTDFKPIRCECGRLLFKASDRSVVLYCPDTTSNIEMKCPGCKKMVYVQIERVLEAFHGSN